MEERWCGMKKNDWILAAAIFFVAVLTIGLQLLKTTDEYSRDSGKWRVVWKIPLGTGSGN